VLVLELVLLFLFFLLWIEVEIWVIWLIIKSSGYIPDNFIVYGPPSHCRSKREGDEKSPNFYKKD